MNFDSPAFHAEGDGEIYRGFNYYAAQSILNGQGQRVLFAWQNQLGMDALAQDHGPTLSERWRGCIAMPAVVAATGVPFVGGSSSQLET